MAAAVASLGFAKPTIIPRWLMWLSIVFFVEQAVETVTFFGLSGFIAPGGHDEPLPGWNHRIPLGRGRRPVGAAQGRWSRPTSVKN